jgi:hypothetical protein
MNATQAFPAPPGLRKDSSKSSRMESGQDRRTPRTIPPIEQRFSPPPGVDRSVSHVGPWPSRPRLSRDSRKRSESTWSLTLALSLGAVVFALGVIRVAPLLGFHGGPIIVHLVWWV